MIDEAVGERDPLCFRLIGLRRVGWACAGISSERFETDHTAKFPVAGFRILPLVTEELRHISAIFQSRFEFRTGGFQPIDVPCPQVSGSNLSADGFHSLDAMLHDGDSRL